MQVTIETTDYGHAQLLGFTDDADPKRPYASTRIDAADKLPDVALKLRALADAIERAHLPAPAVFDTPEEAVPHAITHGEAWLKERAHSRGEFMRNLLADAVFKALKP